MKIRSIDFELSAVRPEQWPKDGLPEFAFLGRSNVGKSSLLNRLVNRKSLARTSATPGKTRQINFYRLNESFRFADLPGYGYASVSKMERASLAKMVERYLTEREPMMRVFHLIDIRHDPSKADQEVHTWLNRMGLSIGIVVTKADKLSKSQQMKNTARIVKILGTDQKPYVVSSDKGTGIEQLWDAIESDLSSNRQD